MKTKIITAIIVFFSLCCFNYAQAQEKKQYEMACIAFYNLENLFDTIHQEGVNDYEFLPDGKNKWNSKKYWNKIHNLSKVISKIGATSTSTGPVILGVSEVENISLLKDLANDPQIKERNYQIIHHDGPDRRGIDVALLYNPSYFTLDTYVSYPLNIADMPDFRTREQLLVRGKLLDEEFHFLVAHWPSRSGGEAKSRPLRIAAATLAKRIFDSIMMLKPDAKIILMGDLNDDPTNKSVASVLNATSDKKKMAAGGYLFNPSESLYKNGIGTLAYRDTWNFFDQMIMTSAIYSDDRRSLVYYQFKVFNEKWMRETTGQYEGYPLRTFSGGTWTDGYSDHFPTYLLLIREFRE